MALCTTVILARKEQAILQNVNIKSSKIVVSLRKVDELITKNKIVNQENNSESELIKFSKKKFRISEKVGATQNRKTILFWGILFWEWTVVFH